MKKILGQAPLVQAILHLRFSDAPSLQVIDPDLLSLIRSDMIDIGFPELIESTGNAVDISFDQATQKVSQNTTIVKRYLFRSAGERASLELTKNSLILKSTDYSTFEDFLKTFTTIMDSYLGSIPELPKMLLKSVGLRYVNAIVPKDNLSLKDLVSEALMPLASLDLGDSSHLHGFTSKVIETSKDQVLSINFEELPVKNNSIYKILPDNLIEPEPKFGLAIEGFDWWGNIHHDTYALLDIDHTYTFKSLSFSSEKVVENITNLYDESSKIFWELATAEAQNAWDLKE
ncbi:MAG: TIGR04255 family protein [Colwellia sp.]|jgi:hypothetical protein